MTNVSDLQYLDQHLHRIDHTHPVGKKFPMVRSDQLKWHRARLTQAIQYVSADRIFVKTRYWQKRIFSLNGSDTCDYDSQTVTWCTELQQNLTELGLRAMKKALPSSSWTKAREQ